MSLITAAPAAAAAIATAGSNVSALIGASVPVARPATAGIRRSISSAASTGGPERAATAPTSTISKPRSSSRQPSATACSGVPLRAPEYIESTVTLTMPAPIGSARSRVLSASCQAIGPGIAQASRKTSP